MKPDQLRMRELLRDKTFRRYFAKQPRLFRPQRIDQQLGKDHWPWFIYVQKTEGSRWQRAKVPTYAKAFEHARTMLKDGVWDLAIHSRRASYAPPDDYEFAQSHDWCPYCRRPTVFWYFRTHHALRKFKHYDLSEQPRCTICGIRLYDNVVTRYGRGRV